MSQETERTTPNSTQEPDPDHDNKKKQEEEPTAVSESENTSNDTAASSWYDIMLAFMLTLTNPSQALDLPGYLKLRNAIAEKFDDLALANAKKNLENAQKTAAEMQANYTADPSPVNSLKQDEANAQVKLCEAEVGLREAIYKEDTARSQIMAFSDVRQTQEWLATQTLTKTARTAVDEANGNLTNIQEKLNDLTKPQIPLTTVKSAVSRNMSEPSIEMTSIKKIPLTHGANSPSPQTTGLTVKS